MHRDARPGPVTARPAGVAARIGLVLAVLLGVVVGLAPAAAAGPAPGGYVALGDSYAAGVGAPPDPASGACLRSPGGYPGLLAATSATRPATSVACSGATTADVLRTQVGALTGATGLVTITVGGNDVGFAPVLAGCTVARTDAGCARFVAAGEAVARFVLPVQLTRLVLAVRSAAPRARIVVSGYPRLFGQGRCPGGPVPDAARRARIDRAADVLDDSIRRTAGALGVGFADVRDAFAGHEVCSADPWLVTPTAGGSAAAYHPTAVGYRDGYLPALLAATRT